MFQNSYDSIKIRYQTNRNCPDLSSSFPDQFWLASEDSFLIFSILANFLLALSQKGIENQLYWSDDSNPKQNIGKNLIDYCPISNKGKLCKLRTAAGILSFIFAVIRSFYELKSVFYA